MVNAMSDFGIGIRNLLGARAFVHRLPVLAAIIRSKRARRRNSNQYPRRIFRVKNNSVQAQAARARLPLGPGAMPAQAGEFLPILSAIGRAEQGGVFNPGINRIRIGQRRLQMPDPLELPGMLRAVIPLVGGEWLAGLSRCVIGKFIAGGFRRTWFWLLSRRRSRLVPGFATIVGALNDLSEPAARLRGINSIRISRRSFQVIHLATRKMRSAHIPLFAFAV